MFFLPLRPAFDSAGAIVPGAQVYFTLTGSNTPSAPFSDAGLATPLENPVVANGVGYLPAIYLDPNVTYRVRVYLPFAEAGVDTPTEEYDPYVPALVGTDVLADLAAPPGASLVGFKRSEAGAVARSLFSKAAEWPTVEDFGAIGDGSADDTAAIQAALSLCTCLRFLPGKTYKVTATPTVPTTCRYIEGTGAQLVGPGSGSTVDGFDFTGFHQGPSTFPTWHQGFKGESYRLPSMTGFRRGISVRNAAFLPIASDVISFCGSAVYIQATSGANNWAVQNIIRVGLAMQCTNALEIDCNSGSVEGIQGCTFDIRYSAGCNVGIKGTFDSASCIIGFNSFRFGNIDGNGASPNSYAAKFDYEITSDVNTFLFENEPINMVPAAGLTPYVNVDKQEVVLSGQYLGDDFAPYHFGGFLPGGFRWTSRPASGTLTIYVDQSLVTTGNGSSASPFKTVAEAVSKLLDGDGFGNTAVIQLAAGTYAEAVSIDARDKGNGRWKIIVAGVLNTPGSVILTGGVTVQGDVHVVLQDLTSQTTGIVANYRANVELNRVNFGAATGQTHLSSSDFSTVDIQADYTISGGAAAHYNVSTGGRIRCLSHAVTISGTPAFSGEFALATDSGSQLTTTGSTYTGSATGTRYLAQLNAVINTGGGGASAFPGSVAGSTATGGQYA